MGWRFGPGPVFRAECLTASRRPAFYGARVVLVGSLLGGLGVVWWSDRLANPEGLSLQGLASIGRSFYMALMGIEFILAVLVAPASTAGAICQDRGRGGLLLLMTTDLSDSEIVLGRLASRLLATLGVIGCGLPVLALSILLGGVDPLAVVGGTLVVMGVASLGVGMALVFSLWASKPHEALSATYTVWAVWLLGPVAWQFFGGGVPSWLRWTNPLLLIFADWPITAKFPWQCRFFAGSMAGITALATLATWQLRSVTLARQGRPSKARSPGRPGPSWLRWIGQAPPRLDDDPVLWREWHRKRPSAFTRVIWWTYAVLGSIFTLKGIHERWSCQTTNALLVSIGLLLACVGAATSLAEERAQGGLDVVLATPLDSRKIAMAKWWGAFRIIPRLAILPGLLALVGGWMWSQPWPENLGFTVLIVGLVLTYGAVVTSLGLLMAIFQPRAGRAVALTVACYLGVTIVYPMIAIPLARIGLRDSMPIWPSPFFGILFATEAATYHFQESNGDKDPKLAFGFVAFEGLVAFALLKVALVGFDRGLGRVSANPGRWASRRGPSPTGRLGHASPARDRSPPP